MNRENFNRYEPGYDRYENERGYNPDDFRRSERRSQPMSEQELAYRRQEAERGQREDIEHPDRRGEMGREQPRRGWGNYRGGYASNWGNEGFYSGYEGVQTSFNGGNEPRNPGDFSHERQIGTYGTAMRPRGPAGGYGGYGTEPPRGGFAGRGPKSYTRSDERIREDVNDRLTDHDEIDASEVEVRVQNCEVTLTGTVPDRTAKRIAEDCALSVRGVKDVHNQIRVQQESTGTQRSGDQA